MTRKELEKHEEEARDLIERLEKRSSAPQAPADFLSRVMSKAEQLPHPRRGLLGGLVHRITSDRRLEALALAACLVVLLAWPLGALRTAWNREHTTSAQIAHLKAEVGKQRELLQELRELIERTDRQALADFKLGKYRDSYKKYLRAAKQQPEKEVFRFRAALAAWYDCRFRKAKDLLEDYLEEDEDDAWGYFALGTAYHSLGDYPAATRQYEAVIALDEGEAAEAAWFNLGVIHTLEFQKSGDRHTLKKVFSHLEKSIETANHISHARRKERMRKIQEAMRPIAQREPMRCVENYAPDDLTALAKDKEFLAWLQNEKKAFGNVY